MLCGLKSETVNELLPPRIRLRGDRRTGRVSVVIELGNHPLDMCVCVCVFFPK